MRRRIRAIDHQRFRIFFGQNAQVGIFFERLGQIDEIAVRFGGDLIDLTKPLEKDTDLRILTEKDPESLMVYGRDSSAHLLAAAVLELFPETKLGHGPATETGFFYDFYRPTPFTPEDLQKLEAKKQNIPYARELRPRDEGLG